jgi:hypothetical protein
MAIARRVTGRRVVYPAAPSLHWNSTHCPLPLREVRGHGRGHAAGLASPPWIDTGNQREPFHFSDSLRRLCADIASKHPPLAHLDVSRILFAFTQSRNQRSQGLQAKLTPLRFRGGQLTSALRGLPFQVQRFVLDGKEMLYVITFCLPRFLNRDFDDKFVTIFHELFHISPEFDGDLRRHHGRYSVHTSSQKRYDQEMMAMAREYLHGGADPKLHGFLRLNFAQLRHRHGKVVGHIVPRPKLLSIKRGLV